MRTIFVGDVHGCRDELESLLVKLEHTPDDRLIFLGDLVDRGPDPAGVVRLVRSIPEVQCIIGNHDDRALRYLMHAAKAAANPAYTITMKVEPARAAEWVSLGPLDVAFLRSLPVTISAAGFVAVHGGFLPGKPIESQKRNTLIRLRWVDANGKFVGMGPDGIRMPEGARPWMEAFDGAFNVVCGHIVYDLERPRFDRTASGHAVWSIDTGCAFGGHLTALVLDSERLDEPTIVQVRARRAYAQLEDAEKD